MKKILSILLLAAPLRLAAYDNVSILSTVYVKKQCPSPQGVALLPGGRLVVADGSGRLSVFGSDGKWIADWGGKGKGAGQLTQPKALAVSRDGRLYVADSGNNRVQVFSSEGKFLTSFGAKGAGPGQLADPAGIAVSADGFVFVADTGNDRVQIFSKDGVYLQGFGSKGETDGLFKSPAGIAVAPNGRVYVVDGIHPKVQIFGVDGKFAGALKRPQALSKGKPIAPKPLAVSADEYGYIYVADANENKISEFDASGEYQGTFGAYGTGQGQFKSLLALGTSKGSVATLDDSLQRVLVFQVDSADKTQFQRPVPTLRLRLKALPPVGLDVDGVSFAGSTMAGLVRKNSQILIAEQYGQKPPKSYGAHGKGDGQMNAPEGIYGRNGVIYVSDTGNRRVLLLSTAGEPVGAGKVGSAGKREGQFKSPKAAAVDGQGRLFVVDPELANCQVFSADGIFLFSIGEPGEGKGQFKRPVDVAVVGRTVAVVDADRKALVAFDDKGKFLWEVAGIFTDPIAVAGDATGAKPFIAVLDGATKQIKVISQGRYVAAFGAGTLFQSPRDIAVDNRGILWVADQGQVKPYDVRFVPRPVEKFAANPGEGQVELSWSADSERLTSQYALQRSTDAASPGDQPYAVILGTMTSYVDEEIVPGLTYYYTLSPVNGAGEDALTGFGAVAKVWTTRPANLPPLEISSINLENIFSAQYKYYTEHPVGRVVIKNNTEKTFQKIQIGFIIQDFMDYPTETVINRFPAGSKEALDLKGVFNNKILSVSEDTPIQAQLTITYFEDGTEKVLKRTQPFQLFSRNAMSWDDPRRLATFITPKDPPLLEFGRGVVGAYQKDTDDSPLGPAIAKAVILHNALGALGVTYLKDPNNPFDKVRSAKAVDYTEYPRELLKRKTGDCDDLTVAYAALLENLSVPVRIADVPGHVFLLFKADGPEADELGDDLAVEIDGEKWVPLETTWVGKPFEDAWKAGMKNYREAADEKRANTIDVEEAWATFAPATLPEGASIASPTREEITKKYPGDLKAVEGYLLESLAAPLAAAAKKDPKDEGTGIKLGLLYAEYEKWPESAAAFDAVLEANPSNASALNNRANIYMLKGEPAKAKPLYEKAGEADAGDGSIQLNVARAAWKTGDKAGAQKAYAKALSLDAGLKKPFGTLEDVVK